MAITKHRKGILDVLREWFRKNDSGLVKTGASSQKIGIFSSFNREQLISRFLKIGGFREWTYADSNGGPHRCQRCALTN